MKNQKTFIFCAFLCITLLCACFSTWDGSGETGKLALKHPGTPGVEQYTVILTSPGRSSIESEPTRDSIIVIDVPPGIWDIEVREEGPDGLTALGDEKVEVKPGETSTVHVKMRPAAQVNKDKGFSEAFEYLDKQELESDDEDEDWNLCYIEITESITADEPITLSVGKNITLRANEDVNIIRGDSVQGSLFQVNGESKLTLGGKGQGKITIRGNDYPSNKALIAVSGTLIMHDGVTLTGNTSYGNGGAVNVDNGGIFIMEGGTISDNTSNPSSREEGNAGGGGGVYVDNGEFIMNGGTISGNKTTGHGAGVRVYEKGTFTMNGGTISGNIVVSSNGEDNGGGVRVRGTFFMKGGTISGNNAPSGGGVSVGDSGGGKGTFTMTAGKISGNTATISNGGGVRVYAGGTFTKPHGGTISGNNPDQIVE